MPWAKPHWRPRTVRAQEWALLPERLTLRVVRCRLVIRGFRTREMLLVTTLLDTAKDPPSALGALYRRRWEMELSLRHLKTTLQMEALSCKRPAALRRELWMHLLVHNLVRRMMLEAARRHRVDLGRVSFAGALGAARRTGEALLQSRSARQRRERMEALWRVLAEDEVPERPGRREPRAVKRRPRPYPRLMRPRRQFRETPHQTRYDPDHDPDHTCCYKNKERGTLYARTTCWYLAPGGADPYEPLPADQRHGYYVVPQLMAGNCKVLNCTGGDVKIQQLAHYGAAKWRDDDQLWWTGAKPGAKLDLALPVAKAGTYEVIVFLTKARDYGIVQFQLDGKKVGDPIDLYSPKVIPSGPVSLGTHDLSASEHKLRVEIIGANEQAVKSYMFGLDYVDLKAK